jgi:hypothetical protein
VLPHRFLPLLVRRRQPGRLRHPIGRSEQQLHHIRLPDRRKAGLLWSVRSSTEVLRAGDLVPQAACSGPDGVPLNLVSRDQR